jgi:hypothetical protein
MATRHTHAVWSIYCCSRAGKLRTNSPHPLKQQLRERASQTQPLFGGFVIVSSTRLSADLVVLPIEQVLGFYTQVVVAAIETYLTHGHDQALWLQTSPLR